MGGRNDKAAVTPRGHSHPVTPEEAEGRRGAIIKENQSTLKVKCRILVNE